MSRSVGGILALAGALLLPAAHGARAEVAVTNGDRILFLGDSITSFGMAPVGYVSLVIHGLKTAGVTAEAIGAGLPGAQSNVLLARLPRLLDKKPTWLLVSCGVNDVYLGPRGVPLDAFRANMTQIVQQARGAGIRVMILTATMLAEDPATAGNRKLEHYNAALRELAKSHQTLLADVHADMQRELATLAAAGRPRGHLLTTSGAHLNARGNVLVAAGVLRAFGLDDATLARARDAWLDIPGALDVRVPLTLRQLDLLDARGARDDDAVQRLLQPRLDAEVVEFLAQ